MAAGLWPDKVTCDPSSGDSYSDREVPHQLEAAGLKAL